MMAPESMTEDEKRLIESALTTLGEHFDTCHIFVTRYEPESKNGGTVTINKGTGNYFARLGQVREWLICEDHKAIKSVTEDDDER